MSLGLLPPVPVAVAGGLGVLLILAQGVVIVRQHDDLVTWRLRDKDQQAVETQLRRDVTDRDAKINSVAGREASDAGATAQACAATISTAYQRGVAFGRAISHAPTSSPAASGGQPASRVVRDYREAWAADSFQPAAR